MKKLLSITMFLVAVLSIVMQANAQSNPLPSKPLRHVVIITFKAGTSADSIQAVDQAFTSLSKERLVKDFEWGIEIADEQVEQETHFYVLSFASREDIKSYEKTPQHDELIRVASPIVADVKVIDYWAEE
ncbi:Stress responsive alpha-beta barrel domain-containing protein [Flammeovirgaceae bacterium 311]|nr:Stress responsive alpha-beta barrel domain-containing protein [Flammeovirgaceae bacterium 311]